ncbi:MAG: hypothetical protein K8S18_16815 [Desulfobacula sp.]|nr:hypothetical protein [Desulfobacula sp.]
MALLRLSLLAVKKIEIKFNYVTPILSVSLHSKFFEYFLPANSYDRVDNAFVGYLNMIII